MKPNKSMTMEESTEESPDEPTETNPMVQGVGCRFFHDGFHTAGQFEPDRVGASKESGSSSAKSAKHCDGSLLMQTQLMEQ